MPSDRIATEIRSSLAPNERFEDFAYLFDALMVLRKPYHENLEASENVGGKILSVLFPDKPKKYIQAMQQFRMGFTGVSTDAALRAEFNNCVRSAAIMVSREEDIVWRPSLYFSLPERRSHEFPNWF